LLSGERFLTDSSEKVKNGRSSRASLVSSASSDPGGDPEDRAPSPVRLEGLLLADLLEQAHDAIVVKDEAHRVVFWNRGAEALYGWSRSEALGRVTHDLLQTALPVPLDAIAEEMERKGFWEGELVHRGRSGPPIVVARRWVVRR